MTLAEARPVLAALGESVARGASRRSRAIAEPRLVGLDGAARRRHPRPDRDRRRGFGREPDAVWHHIHPMASRDARRDCRIGRRRRARGCHGRTGRGSRRAVESPGGDERLQFARQVIERHGIAVGAALARGDATISARPCGRACSRTTSDTRAGPPPLRPRATPNSARRTRRSIATAVSRPTRRSASTLPSSRRSPPSARSWRADGPPVERVAVVGPGLDFVDKAQGHDFYPVQMIQPFALADSLRASGTRGAPGDHGARHQRQGHRAPSRCAAARAAGHCVPAEPAARARQSRVDRSIRQLVEYWRRFGDRLGVAVAVDVPPTSGDVRARAVDLRPEAVLDVEDMDLNIVLERLATPS